MKSSRGQRVQIDTCENLNKQNTEICNSNCGQNYVNGMKERF